MDNFIQYTMVVDAHSSLSLDEIMRRMAEEMDEKSKQREVHDCIVQSHPEGDFKKRSGRTTRSALVQLVSQLGPWSRLDVLVLVSGGRLGRVEICEFSTRPGCLAASYTHSTDHTGTHSFQLVPLVRRCRCEEMSR